MHIADMAVAIKVATEARVENLLEVGRVGAEKISADLEEKIAEGCLLSSDPE